MIVSIAIYVGVFIFGFFTGVAAICTYALYKLRQYDKSREKFAKELSKTAKEITDKTKSARERLDRAFEICEEQFDILSGMEGPQSGPLHGKHKQQMNIELKRLEEEKMTIFRSILADGFDPKLTTINENGEKETLKLSDFIKKRELISGEQGANQPAQEPKQRKLSIVKSTENKED